MEKKYLKLLKEQKERGVIFSSQFISSAYNSRIHEVFINDNNKDEKIKKLKNDLFFDGLYEYNLIRS